MIFWDDDIRNDVVRNELVRRYLPVGTNVSNLKPSLGICEYLRSTQKFWRLMVSFGAVVKCILLLFPWRIFFTLRFLFRAIRQPPSHNALLSYFPYLNHKSLELANKITGKSHRALSKFCSLLLSYNTLGSINKACLSGQKGRTWLFQTTLKKHCIRAARPNIYL